MKMKNDDYKQIDEIIREVITDVHFKMVSRELQLAESETIRVIRREEDIIVNLVRNLLDNIAPDESDALDSQQRIQFARSRLSRVASMLTSLDNKLMNAAKGCTGGWHRDKNWC
jgi:hypothetical protein